MKPFPNLTTDPSEQAQPKPSVLESQQLSNSSVVNFRFSQIAMIHIFFLIVWFIILTQKEGHKESLVTDLFS